MVVDVCLSVCICVCGNFIWTYGMLLIVSVVNIKIMIKSPPSETLNMQGNTACLPCHMCVCVCVCVLNSCTHTHKHRCRPATADTCFSCYVKLLTSCLFCVMCLWHTRSQGWWLGNILPITAPLKFPLLLGSSSSHLTQPPLHVPPKSHHLSFILYSSLLSFLAFLSPTHPPPLALLSPVTPDQKDLDPTWNRQTLEGYILCFPGERLQRHRTNRQEKQKQQSFNFPVCITFSQLIPFLIPLFLGAFHLIPLRLLVFLYFEMLNLPPLFE